MILGSRSTDTEEHLEWLDVLKGLGIISVVWGHSGSSYGYLMFMFHMPLFFFISGYLYKPRTDQSWLKNAAARSKHLLIPYIFYLSLITLMSLVLAMRTGHPLSTAVNWTALLLGGSMLAGNYATFWFVTCLFVVQIGYDLLRRKIQARWLRFIIVAGFYLLAHWESSFHQDVFVPWNADVAMFAISFYALGNAFRIKKWLEEHRKRLVLITSAVVYCVLFFSAYALHYIDFGLDLKHRQYYYFGSSVLTPLTITIILAGLSLLLTKWPVTRKILCSLGRASMPVMYLHLVVGNVIKRYTTISPVEFTVAGLALPWLWYKICILVPSLRIVALGLRSPRIEVAIQKIDLRT